MATIRLLATNSIRGVLDQVLPLFQAATGHQVEGRFDPVKLMLSRIRGGESGDLGILAVTAIDTLVKEGRMTAGSRRVLARCGIGVGVRKGAPKPDIGSVEAFKRALLDARSVAYTAEGTSGIYFAKLIERFGIAQQVTAKGRTQAGGLIGEFVVRGEAEIAIQQIPELLAVPGLELVGPLPDDIQLFTTSAAGVFTDAAQPKAAQELIDFLRTPEAVRAYKAVGHEPHVA